MVDVDARVQQTIHLFSRIYLGGIPGMITDDSAFLSFVCALTGTEALAGYRYPNEPDASKRFNTFVTDYFPKEYSVYSDGRLWTFRCRMIHSFSPVGFSLVHHRSDVHLALGENGQPILNAEDFYTALVAAAQKYFAELRIDPAVQSALIQRLDHDRGGAVNVGVVRLGRDPGTRLTST